MIKRKPTILWILLIVLLLNVAVVSYVLPAGNKTHPDAPAVSESQPAPEPVVSETVVSPTEVIRWQGWQEASPAADMPAIYSDRQLTQPLELSQPAEGKIIICERDEDLCKVRWGSLIGWTTIDNLTVSGSDAFVYPQSEPDSSQPASLAETEIGGRLNAIAKKYKCVGVQAAVITDGKISHLYEYGYQDKSKKLPVTPDTKIRVASLSKVITGMGVLSMQDLGILDIDEDISTYWGASIKNPKFPDNPVTLRNILTHTSSYKDFGYKKRALTALDKNLKKSSSFTKTKPGDIESYKYNNSAICAAGAIAGRAGNCNFDQYIREYFFAPLGIDASYHAKNITGQEHISVVYNDGTPTVRVKEFLGMTFYGGVGEDYTYYSGGMIISAKDLAKMVCVLLGQGSYEQMYYLKPETVSAMLERQYQLGTFDQCLVLRYKDDLIGEHDLYYHNGNMAGVYSLLCFDPTTGNGMVVVTNGCEKAKVQENIYDVCAELAAVAAELWTA